MNALRPVFSGASLLLICVLCGCSERPSLSLPENPDAPASQVEETVVTPAPLPESVPQTYSGILSLEREELDILPRVTRMQPENSAVQPEQSYAQSLSPQNRTSAEYDSRAASLAHMADTPRQQTVLNMPDIYSLSPHAHLLRRSSPLDNAAAAQPKRKSPSTPYNATVTASSEAVRPKIAPSERVQPLSGEAQKDWNMIIEEASGIFGVDPALLRAVIRVESAFNHTARSRAGAEGAMQVMPSTQEALGLIDPFDPRANVYAGAQYLMHLLQRFPTVEMALAAYNAGPGAVKKYGGVPPYTETRNYVRRIMQLWRGK